MGIFGFLARRRTARTVEQSAAEVARRSYQPVMDRVRRRASAMRIAEARGYVRARSLDIVHRELSALHGGKIPHDPATQTQIISRATDAVVASVLAGLRSVPQSAKTSTRKAA
jgi:hypothetical protein